jgi:hypothetical protein
VVSCDPPRGTTTTRSGNQVHTRAPTLRRDGKSHTHARTHTLDRERQRSHTYSNKPRERVCPYHVTCQLECAANACRIPIPVFTDAPRRTCFPLPSCTERLPWYIVPSVRWVKVRRYVRTFSRLQRRALLSEASDRRLPDRRNSTTARRKSSHMKSGYSCRATDQLSERLSHILRSSWAYRGSLACSPRM